MCGRFYLLMDLPELMARFDIQEALSDYRPGSNISPGQPLAAVIHDDKNRLVSFRWGLVPSWARDPSIGNRMFNARAETVAEKPSFKGAFQKRRCLIPAEGFYEWQKVGKGKKPFRFFLKSQEPFGFAGLYETWNSPGREPIQSCTVITTEPNELVRPAHDRMPVILPKDRQAAWIDPGNRNLPDLRSLLKPYPAEEMAVAEVDPKALSGPGGPESPLFRF